jgi:phage terminase large subunit
LLAKRIDEAYAKLFQKLEKGERDYSKYKDDPVGFVRDVLSENPTPDQEDVLRAIITPPYKVIVRSAHNVGKSWLCACIILWFSKTQGDSFRLNSTASTYDQINEAVWGEVRAMDAKSGLNLMRGVRPVIQLGPKAVAKGFTAKTPTAFQGRRGLRNGLIADEAMGIEPSMFPAMESIFGGERYFGLYTFNPTDPSSHLRMKEESGEYRVIVLSQENHPNVIAARKGEAPPYPSAITLEVYERQLRERSDPVLGEPMPTDVIIGWIYGPNGEKVGGEWRRPNYEACCRNLGRWPDQSSVSIWTPRMFQEAVDRVLPDVGALQIGIDVARYGSCNTAYAVRRGGNLLHVESYNGWNTTQISERAKELCYEYGKRYGMNPREVPVAIDGTGGWGAGVEDKGIEDHYNFIPVIAGEKAIDASRYYLIRDELWCGLREHAEANGVSFKLVPKSVIDIIRPQALAAKYEYRGTKKKVLPKEEMAEMLSGRSPDEFEAVLLAYANVTGLQHRERVAGRVV